MSKSDVFGLAIWLLQILVVVALARKSKHVSEDIMSKADAEHVKRILESAQEAAKPLRDRELTKKIDEATKHVEKRIDPSEKTTG